MLILLLSVLEIAWTEEALPMLSPSEFLATHWAMVASLALVALELVVKVLPPSVVYILSPSTYTVESDAMEYLVPSIFSLLLSSLTLSITLETTVLSSVME